MRADGGWDVHTHLVPPAADRPALPELGDAGALARWVASAGLTGAVVSPPPPLYRPDLSGIGRRRWVAAVNDGMGELCAEHSDALVPLAYVPAEAPAEAVRVAQALGEGWAGVVAGTDLAGGVYSSPEYDPLWDLLSDRGLPLFVHPGHCPDPRLEPFYLTNLLGNPYETTVAAAHLVLGGVLERFPTLRVVLAHGGGAVAALAGRWQRGADTDRPGLHRLELAPGEAVRRFHVDSLVHSPAALRLVREVVGPDRVLLSTDWPFPMGADSIELDGLSVPEARAVRVDNARRCFGDRLSRTGGRR
jgi:aminocarboxymuconate-semialdehyde decarboxylase